MKNDVFAGVCTALVTPFLDEEKYDFVKEALWQKDGKFVGLDHQIPLGANGITLSDY